jgi:adenylate cyclase
VLLLLVWSHACIGLHHWLKFKIWYRHLQPFWVVLAVAVPMAALMGFIVSGRFVAALLSDPATAERMRGVTHWPDVAAAAWLALDEIVARVGFAIVLALVAIGVAFRQFGMLAAPKIAISYAGGPTIQAPVGPTLLEISRGHGVTHLSECGGRLRCGLCRVRIDEGGENLTPRNDAERTTLALFKAPDNARLACQVRPRAPLSVTRLVASKDEPVTAAVPERADDAGVRRPLSLLHVQLREPDVIARDRLPYDLVFMLNAFFSAVGEAIESHDGRVDRFLGDGVLAVFGEQQGLEQGCKDAVNAARAIDLVLDRVNEQVAAEIGRPMQVAIGLHSGEMVLGRVHLGRSGDPSVLGPGVDIPQRLAGLAEQRGWQLALSSEVVRHIDVSSTGAAYRTTLAAKKEGDAAIELIGIARCRDITVGAAVKPAATAP